MTQGEAAYQHTSGIVDQANLLIREADKQRQVKKITKLYKYKFGWSRKTIFLYILKTLPELKEKITEECLKNSNLTQLYAAAEKKQLSVVIQRLEQIEKKNESQKVEDEL